MSRKTVQELISVNEPSWDHYLSEWISVSRVGCEIHDPELARSEDVLERLQITVRSTLGGLIHQSAGLTIDHGWIRLFGAGSKDVPEGILEVTSQYGTLIGASCIEDFGLLIVGEDVAGGVFAINGGALEAPCGNVLYFQPDALEWLDLDYGYSAFAHRVIDDGFGDFFRDLKWEGWEPEVAALGRMNLLTIYPPLWSKEYKLQVPSRRPAPASAQRAMNADISRAITGAPFGLSLEKN